MSYQTPTEFRRRGFASGSFDDLSDSIVQDALDVAASEIDGSLRAHHTLPLTSGSIPALIFDAEAVIAAWRLFLFQGSKPDGVADDTFTRRYDEITGEKGLLFKLSRGQIILADDVDATPGNAEGGPRVVANPTSNTTFRTFSSDGKQYF